jgi:hypothetical protein
MFSWLWRKKSAKLTKAEVMEKRVAACSAKSIHAAGKVVVQTSDAPSSTDNAQSCGCKRKSAQELVQEGTHTTAAMVRKRRKVHVSEAKLRRARELASGLKADVLPKVQAFAFMEMPLSVVRQYTSERIQGPLNPGHSGPSHNTEVLQAMVPEHLWSSVEIQMKQEPPAVSASHEAHVGMAGYYDSGCTSSHDAIGCGRKTHTIVLRSDLTPEARNWTLRHECAHFALHRLAHDYMVSPLPSVVEEGMAEFIAYCETVRHGGDARSDMFRRSYSPTRSTVSSIDMQRDPTSSAVEHLHLRYTEAPQAFLALAMKDASMRTVGDIVVYVYRNRNLPIV